MPLFKEGLGERHKCLCCSARHIATTSGRWRLQSNSDFCGMLRTARAVEAPAPTRDRITCKGERFHFFIKSFLRGPGELFFKKAPLASPFLPFFIPSTPCRSVGSAGRPRQGRRRCRRPRGRGERCRDRGGRGRRIQRWFSSSCQWYAEPWRWSAWA